MKLVIDIPEEVYKSIQENDYCGISNGDMYNAVKNGTPLPKGHGDLIAEIDKLPRIKVGNSNSPTVKYCIDEVLLYDLFEQMPM